LAAFSDYLENWVIDFFLRNTAFTPPATVYVALFTSSSGLESNNPTAEVSGGAYARQVCALDAASGGVSANTSDITFPIATADWGTVTHIAIVDHLTNTTWGTNVNVLMWAALDTARIVLEGDRLKFDAGEIDIQLA